MVHSTLDSPNMLTSSVPNTVVSTLVLSRSDLFPYRCNPCLQCLYHFLIEFAVGISFSNFLGWSILSKLSSELSLNSYHRFRWIKLQHSTRFLRLTRHLTSVLYSSGNSWNYFLRMRSNKTVSFYLQWCAFNFCVAITFLPINLCNRSHQL
jgi:hypothetical protein